ncbi:MAG: FIST C-terminal domain-containing protein [Coriobacteriia bacterium]|nr:FIST C-terminal domain-containing protein [Coriobacteriia bacterium]
MLSFKSADVRSTSSDRAIDECISEMYGDAEPEAGTMWIVNACIGHRLDNIADAIRARVPDVLVVGGSCGGIIGCEGAGEAMTHLAVLVVRGSEDELAYSVVDGYGGAVAYEKGLELARNLMHKLPDAHVIYLLAPGLDARNDELLRALTETFGSGTIIFGGVSSDNNKGIMTSQYIGDRASARGAWAIGFADKTLHASTSTTHGFLAYGEPMTVTKAEGNVIIEFDGRPAWEVYSERLGRFCADEVQSLFIAGGLAKELSAEQAEKYGNTHILRGGFPGGEDGSIRLSVSANVGDRYCLTARDEERVFAAQKKALETMCADIAAKSLDGKIHPVAVFQTDCLFRGRLLFGKVMKDEIIGMMQSALLDEDNEVPPWLGMYGFGEFCPLAGENLFHTYTSSLLVLYR